MTGTSVLPPYSRSLIGRDIRLSETEPDYAPERGAGKENLPKFKIFRNPGCAPFSVNEVMRQTGPEDRPMTFEEMVAYLLETYPPDRYSDEELRGYIIAELENAETRGGITAEVRDRVYRHFGVTTQGYGGPG